MGDMRGGKSGFSGQGNYRFDTCHLGSPYSYSIVRVAQCFEYRNFTAKFSAVVPGGPHFVVWSLVIERNGCVKYMVDRKDPAFIGSRIYKGFKGGSWLAVGLNRTVELAVLKILTSCHGKDLTGRGIKGHKCSFSFKSIKRILGFFLKVKVNSSMYLKTASVDLFLTVFR